jgi:hypothetical protein
MPIPRFAPAPLSTRLARADLAQQQADQAVYQARLLDVARLTRDRHPDAAAVVVDATELYAEPFGVVLAAVLDEHGKPLETPPDDGYCTTDGHSWDDVVYHIGYELTRAMGSSQPHELWPQEAQYPMEFFHVDLPSTAEVAAALGDEASASAEVVR